MNFLANAFKKKKKILDLRSTYKKLNLFKHFYTRIYSSSSSLGCFWACDSHR